MASSKAASSSRSAAWPSSDRERLRLRARPGAHRSPDSCAIRAHLFNTCLHLREEHAQSQTGTVLTAQAGVARPTSAPGSPVRFRSPPGGWSTQPHTRAADRGRRPQPSSGRSLLSPSSSRLGIRTPNRQGVVSPNLRRVHVQTEFTREAGSRPAPGTGRRLVAALPRRCSRDRPRVSRRRTLRTFAHRSRRWSARR